MNDFIDRTVFPTTPVAAIYEATPYSDTLRGVLHELNQWGKQHREKVKQSMQNDKGEKVKPL